MSLLTITDETAALALTGERLTVTQTDGTVSEAPLCEIDRVIICGYPHISLTAVLKLLRGRCPVLFLSTGGRWLGQLSAGMLTDPARCRRQFACADEPRKRVIFAKALLTAKISNQHRVLAKLASRRRLKPAPAALTELLKLRGRLTGAADENELRGIEGMAAVHYFAFLSRCLPKSLGFAGRVHHPPADPVNALLSFSYAVVAGEIDARLRVHGLESTVGFFHHERHGFPALAWDLLEIFRAPLCDSLSLHLFNHKLLGTDDFQPDTESGGVRLKPEARKIFFREYERKRAALFRVPGEKAKVCYQRLFEESVLETVDWLNGAPEPEFFRLP